MCKIDFLIIKMSWSIKFRQVRTGLQNSTRTAIYIPRRKSPALLLPCVAVGWEESTQSLYLPDDNKNNI